MDQDLGKDVFEIGGTFLSVTGKPLRSTRPKVLTPKAAIMELENLQRKATAACKSWREIMGGVQDTKNGNPNAKEVLRNIKEILDKNFALSVGKAREVSEIVEAMKASTVDDPSAIRFVSAKDAEMKDQHVALSKWVDSLEVVS